MKLTIIILKLINLTFINGHYLKLNCHLNCFNYGFNGIKCFGIFYIKTRNFIEKLCFWLSQNRLVWLVLNDKFNSFYKQIYDANNNKSRLINLIFINGLYLKLNCQLNYSNNNVKVIKCFGVFYIRTRNFLKKLYFWPRQNLFSIIGP